MIAAAVVASASSSSSFPSLYAFSSTSSSRSCRRNFSSSSSSLPFPSGTAVRVSQLRCQTVRVRSTRHPHGAAAPVVTRDSWDELVLKSEVPVLVEFFANWCGPCRMVHRMIDEIAEEYAQDIKCFLLNTDTDLDIAERYAVKAVPVVLMFKNGQKCESVVGTMPKDFYVAAIQRVLDS